MARRRSLHTSQLFAWRKLARDGGLRAGSAGQAAFAPVVVSATVDPVEACSSTPAIGAEETASPCGTSERGRMEIIVGRGRRIIVFADVDIDALARVLPTVERR